MTEEKLIGILSLGAPTQKGAKGDRGEIGPVGPVGPRGEQGPRGLQGIQGERGIQGIQGPIGPRGEKGEQGIQGKQGIQGEQGIQGPQGRQGERGPQGQRGEMGPQGDQGPKGERGNDGFTGATGPQGPQGRQGERGERGEIGPGFRLVGEANRQEDIREPKQEGDCYFITSTKEVVMWTGSKWVNFGVIKGPRGDRGERGLEGPLGPQGPTGERGPQGEKGDKGDKGEKGDIGESAIIDNKVSNLNTWSSKQIIDHLLQENEWKALTTNELTDATNGYIKGLEIEGQTLKSLVVDGRKSNTQSYICHYKLRGIEEGKRYTIIYKLSGVIKGNYEVNDLGISINNSAGAKTKRQPFKDGIYKVEMGTLGTKQVSFWTTPDNVGQQFTISDVSVIEGDYTQKDVPDFIEGVQGVGRKGKNLFNMNDTSNIKNGQKVKFNNLECLAGKDGPQNLTITNKFKENTQYTFTSEVFREKDGKDGVGVRIRYTDETSEVQTFEVNRKSTIVSDETKTIKSITIDNRMNKNYYLSEIQLEQGDHATPYEPYFEGYKLGVKTHGKNLFNIDNFNSKKIGNNEYEVSTAIWQGKKITLPFKENTQYTFKATQINNIRGAGWLYLKFAYTDNTDSEIKHILLKPGQNQDKIFTSERNKTLKEIKFSYSDSGVYVLKNIQLEEGTQATKYQPYKESTSEIILQDQLQGIGDIKDKLYFDEGYKVEKNIGLYEFTGEEIFSQQGTASEKIKGMYISTDKIPNFKKGVGKVKLLSNTLTYEEVLIGASNNGLPFVVGVNSSGTNLLIDIPIEINLKEWLKENKTILLYPVATPTTTDTQIKTELLPQTYKNKTYVSVDSGVKGELKGEYPLDDFKAKVDAILLAHGLIQPPHATLEELEADEPTTLEEFEDEGQTLEEL